MVVIDSLEGHLLMIMFSLVKVTEGKITCPAPPSVVAMGYHLIELRVTTTTMNIY